MRIAYTLEKLLKEITLNSSRGRRHYDAGPEECMKADKESWAEYKAIAEMLGDEKMNELISVEYPDEE